MAGQTKTKATTVYLDPKVAKAMKVKAAMTERSVSQLINETLRGALRQDEDDLRYVRKHRHDAGRPLEEFLAEMKRNGEL